MNKVVSIVAAVFTVAIIASAQTKTTDKPAAPSVNTTTSVKAQYEGGIYGSAGHTKGTITLVREGGAWKLAGESWSNQ